MEYVFPSFPTGFHKIYFNPSCLLNIPFKVVTVEPSFFKLKLLQNNLTGSVGLTVCIICSRPQTGFLR